MIKFKYPTGIYLKTLSILILLIFIYGLLPAHAEELFFIIHPSEPVKELKRADIKKLYTGKRQYWDSGEAVTLGYLKDPTIHKVFTKKYVKKSPRQFTNFWRNQIFIGQAQMLPKGFNTQKEMVEFVSGTKGAIGYVSSNQNLDGVKIIPVKGN